MPDTYRFGPYELDPRTAELRRAGEPVPLQLQPARILQLLVERAGELVSREEIRARVWPDRVVDYEQGLNYAIRQIRSALGDDADAPVYFETLPRRGYRFAVRVERISEPAPGRAPRRRVLAFALAGLVLAAGGVAAVSTVGRGAQSEPAPPRDPATREAYLIGRGLLPSRDQGKLEQARQEFDRVLEGERVTSEPSPVWAKRCCGWAAAARPAARWSGRSGSRRTIRRPITCWPRCSCSTNGSGTPPSGISRARWRCGRTTRRRTRFAPTGRR